MLNYQFECIDFADGKTSLIIVMDDLKEQLVARFLMSDIQSKDADGYLAEIDDVLADKKNRAEFSGNVCTVEVLREISTIYNDLDDDAAPCRVATEDLRQIIDDWCRTKKEFNKNKALTQ